MAWTAQAFGGARALKLKLTGEPIDGDRVRAVRDAKPEAWLGIDANQGFTRRFLEQLMPVLVDSKVSLIEQPFRIGEEVLLEGFQSPIPIAADESAQDLLTVNELAGRFDMANIKLDKCGGLTEGLAMAFALRELGLGVMVGCMGGNVAGHGACDPAWTVLRRSRSRWPRVPERRSAGPGALRQWIHPNSGSRWGAPSIRSRDLIP